MNETNHQLDITPDTTLYSKMGESGHTHADATNELIDNSIDARTSENLEVRIQATENSFEITDNGSGMDMSEVGNAMRLAYSDKDASKLGRYGLGMKSAMMRFGGGFILITKKKGSTKKIVVDFDKDRLEQTSDSWKIDCVEIDCEPNEYQKSFTTVQSTKFRTRLTKKMIQSMQTSIAKKFRSFISDESIKIIFNGDIVKPRQPSFVPKTKKTFNIYLSNGERIHGFTAILKIPSDAESGFNMYRNNRLIIGGERIGSRSIMITGDIHADCLHVGSTKREFVRDDLYEEFEQQMKPIIDDVLREAKQHEKPPMSQKIQENLVGMIEGAIGTFSESIQKKPGMKFERDEEGSIELVDVEKREKAGGTGKEQNETDGKRVRVPKKTHKAKRRGIYIRGKLHSFDVEWSDLHQDLAKTSYFDEDGVIKVILNKSYAGLHALQGRKPSQYYFISQVTESVVERIYEKNPEVFQSEGVSFLQAKDKIIGELAMGLGVMRKKERAKRDSIELYTIVVKEDGKFLFEESGKTQTEASRKVANRISVTSINIQKRANGTYDANPKDNYTIEWKHEQSA